MTEPASINPGLIDEARQFIAEKQPGFSLVGQLIDAIDRLRADIAAIEGRHAETERRGITMHRRGEQAHADRGILLRAYRELAQEKAALSDAMKAANDEAVRLRAAIEQHMAQRSSCSNDRGLRDALEAING